MNDEIINAEFSIEHKPLISVVMPVYRNVELEKTLKSLKNQIFTDYELIAVVKPSEDKCEEIIYNYFPNATIVMDEGNVSVARNIGLDDAKGSYIAFLDSDDIWDKTYLQQMSEHFVDRFGLYTCCKTKFNTNDYFELCSKENKYPYYTSGMIVRKNDIRFDESMTIGEDVKYFTDVANTTQSYHLNEDLVYYRVPEWNKHLNFSTPLKLPVEDSPEKFKHQFYLRWCMNTGLKNLVNGFVEDAKQQLKECKLGWLCHMKPETVRKMYSILMAYRQQF